jgi:hypothetical protein
MNNRKLLFLALMFPAVSLFAADFSYLWETPRLVKNKYYEIEIPAGWQDFPIMSKGVERNFNIVGDALPVSYNGVRVLASFYMSFEAGRSEDESVKNVRQSKAAGAARTEDESFKANGWKGTLIKSFSEAKMNGRNGQRYDLVVYSKERGGSYIFSMFIQFNDVSGGFVKEFKLDSFAETVFKHIWFFDNE